MKELYSTLFLNTNKGRSCDMYYSLIQNNENVLEFRDTQHFNSVLECLEASVEAYNDAFEAIYGSLTDDEVDIVEQQIGFYEDQPLLDFENKLGFYSLRKKIEGEEEILLANDALDDENDPDDHFILDEELRTLLTINCNAKISSELIDFCYADDLQRLGICIFFDCCHTGTGRSFYYYNNGNRRYKIRVGLGLILLVLQQNQK